MNEAESAARMPESVKTRDHLKECVITQQIAVGLYSSFQVTHHIESAWFQPLSVEVKNMVSNCCRRLPSKES
jgi:hypothetical protein